LLVRHEVVVIDNFSNGCRLATDRVKKIVGREFELMEADVRDQGTLDTLFSRFKPEAVVHFAGLKSVGESVAKPIEYYDVNVGGTISLLHAMLKAECNNMVFSSSATVYGTPHYLPYDENHPTSPINPYGRTKLMVEQMLGDWCAQNPKHKAISLRYFNPVGAHPSGRIGEHPRGIPNNLMPLVTQVATGRRDRLQIYGDDFDTPDGTGERDYVHVMDLAAAHSLALHALDGLSGHTVLNIGTGKSTSVLELIAAFEAASGRKIEKEIVARRAGDLPSFCAAAAMADKVLCWRSKYSLEQMCRDSWTWQSRNPLGYGSDS
jgi:UDP-glucose 4-epimerase